MASVDVDVVVVGAGIGGLCAAKTYKELAPETSIQILESVSSIEAFVDHSR